MSFGIKELLVIAVIVLLLFGTKKLRNMGSDLGASVKGFKKAMNEEENKDAALDDASTAEKVNDTETTEEKTTNS